MRICIIGEFRPVMDEGYINISTSLSNELVKSHEVIKLNPWLPYSAGFWHVLGQRCPDIIHYITAPSIFSFWVLRLLKLRWRKARTIMSALHPDGFSLQRNITFRKSILTCKPDLILTHSKKMGEMFTSFGYKTGFLANGVNSEKFQPCSPQLKKQLRRKYGIEEDKFIILHVGHIKRDRNVQFFRQIQNPQNQVLIVGSSYRGGGDEKLIRELRSYGCMVWLDYYPNIEELYALADCYVFPAEEDGCLLLPLSVMEAMACNIPVVTTIFGALPDIFGEGEGLFYADKESDFIKILESIRKDEVEINTRQKVLPYTWENITRELDGIYTRVVSEDGG